MTFSDWSEELEAKGLSLDEFLHLAIPFIEKDFPRMTIKKEADGHISGKLEGVGTFHANMKSFWVVAEERAGERRMLLFNFAQRLDQTTPESKRQPPSLGEILPVVRQKSDTVGARPIYQIIGDLHAYLVIDTPETMEYLAPSILDKLGKSDEELLEIARINLKIFLEERAVVLKPMEKGIYMATCQGDYESSLLLMEGFWKTVSDKLQFKGRMIVAIPARDQVYFVDETNSEGCHFLKEAVLETYKNSHHPLTPSLYRKREVGFEMY